jgi:hypothetical protein
MNEEERDELLRYDIIDRDAIRHIRPEDDPLPLLLNIHRSSRIQEFTIEAEPTEEGYRLSAYGHWEGTMESIEITQWVKFRVFSEFARLDNFTHVIVGCGVGDIVVEADLFGEARAEQKIAVHKPVRDLLIEMDAKGDNLEQSRQQRARLVAFCEDGTQSEVSCGAEWKMLSGAASVRACGKLEVRHEPVRVQASYGGKRTAAEIYFNRREAMKVTTSP